MLPELNKINEQEVMQPSLTYNVNRNTNRISGYVDGKEAIVQACYLILQTERHESLIYNWYYGTEFDSLISELITKHDTLNKGIDELIKKYEEEKQLALKNSEESKLKSLRAKIKERKTVYWVICLRQDEKVNVLKKIITDLKKLKGE